MNCMYFFLFLVSVIIIILIIIAIITVTLYHGLHLHLGVVPHVEVHNVLQVSPLNNENEFIII